MFPEFNFQVMQQSKKAPKILACPACGSDRQSTRLRGCKHSWHADGGNKRVAECPACGSDRPATRINNCKHAFHKD